MNDVQTEGSSGAMIPDTRAGNGVDVGENLGVHVSPRATLPDQIIEVKVDELEKLSDEKIQEMLSTAEDFLAQSLPWTRCINSWYRSKPNKECQDN